MALPRIGRESADTLLLYLFGRPTLVVDTYLRRVAWRHFALAAERIGDRGVRGILGEVVLSRDEAHRVHARLNEIGVLFCRAEAPECERCPLRRLARRALP